MDLRFHGLAGSAQAMSLDVGGKRLDLRLRASLVHVGGGRNELVEEYHLDFHVWSPLSFGCQRSAATLPVGESWGSKRKAPSRGTPPTG